MIAYPPKMRIITSVLYQCFLLLGAPGSGKGTQGKILGTIPGFYHCACGDVFRAIDIRSDFGKAFLHYSSKGQLVPDDITIGLWSAQIDAMERMGRFRPETDFLILDGIPRNVSQAKILSSKLAVHRIYHLDCPDKTKVYDRLKRRALKENRIDDINDATIQRRQEVYEQETKPVLDFYGEKMIARIDSSKRPFEVLRDILADIEQHGAGPIDPDAAPLMAA
jgi:adenylate kinase